MKTVGTNVQDTILCVPEDVTLFSVETADAVAEVQSFLANHPTPNLDILHVIKHGDLSPPALVILTSYFSEPEARDEEGQVIFWTSCRFTVNLLRTLHSKQQYRSIVKQPREVVPKEDVPSDIVNAPTYTHSVPTTLGTVLPMPTLLALHWLNSVMAAVASTSNNSASLSEQLRTSSAAFLVDLPLITDGGGDWVTEVTRAIRFGVQGVQACAQRALTPVGHVFYSHHQMAAQTAAMLTAVFRCVAEDRVAIETVTYREALLDSLRPYMHK